MNMNQKNIDEIFDRLFYREPVPSYLLMHIYLNHKEFEQVMEMSHELVKSREYSVADLLFFVIKVGRDDLTMAFIKSFEITKFPKRAIAKAVREYGWAHLTWYCEKSLLEKVERAKDIVLANHLSNILLSHHVEPTKTKRRM